MGIKEIIMLHVTTYFIISILLTECISNRLSLRYQQIISKLPVTAKLMLVVVYLTSIVSASFNHEPQVYEDLNEDMPEVVRRTRHLGSSQQVYQPPVFNYRTATQQDPMKTRYRRQQQADFSHIHIKTVNPDKFFELSQYLAEKEGTPKTGQLAEIGADWKPFQPQFMTPPMAKSHKVASKSRFTEITQNSFGNDLDIAASENKEVIAEEKVKEKVDEKKVETDRQDRQSRYIYVQPNILKNNFGIESKAVHEMLKNSAPAVPAPKTEEFHLTELQELLGKNPEYQLQGLQKLLEDVKPIMQNLNQNPVPLEGGTGDVEINSSNLPVVPSHQPPIADLQKQLDAVNRAHANAALAAAQKQAEAHVRAQHAAIALAQNKAEAEAFAKIAAHNQGKAIINPNQHVQILDVMGTVTAAPLVAETPRPQLPRQEVILQQIDQNSIEAQPEKAEESALVENVNAPETLALNSRPFEEVLLDQHQGGDQGYAPSFTDLRNNKPIINFLPRNKAQPTPFTRVLPAPPLFKPLAAVSEVYAPSEVQNYAPVIPKPQRVLLPGQLNNHLSVPTTPNVQEHRQDSYQQIQIETRPSADNQLYSEGKDQQYDDVHQYAPKYAFGYRVLDEKHGNDFGHEEERDGKVTKGHYFSLLPDGRRQKVEYYVDNDGYHARVSYENVGTRSSFVPIHPHQEQVEHRLESEPVNHK